MDSARSRKDIDVAKNRAYGNEGKKDVRKRDENEQGILSRSCGQLKGGFGCRSGDRVWPLGKGTFARFQASILGAIMKEVGTCAPGTTRFQCHSSR